MTQTKRIQVFEHSFLPIGGDFKQRHFVALSKLNALHQDCYFDLRHNGVKFKQFVGVIQVDGLCIEILPKIDNNGTDENVWQGVLIEMLRVTKKLKVQKVGNAHVSKQQIHLLDIYFEWFLSELQLLIHQGLIKQYYKETANVKALKGKLEFSGHISKNLVHKERFYTTHQVYDKDHLVHQVLNKALEIVEKCSKGMYLYSKCKTVQLDFPDVKAIVVNENTFNRIPKSRKIAPYETALEIAKFIILNFAPNISKGSENMLALLFDMNALWEEYILVRLKQAAKNVIVHGQQSKLFWSNITIRPDIVIERLLDLDKQTEDKKKETFVIDTKWKNINGGKPSTDDLRQMYVYNDYWKSKKAVLLYPSPVTKPPVLKNIRGIIDADHHECGIAQISIFKPEELILNNEIGTDILKWF